MKPSDIVGFVVRTPGFDLHVIVPFPLVVATAARARLLTGPGCWASMSATDDGAKGDRDVAAPRRG